MVERVKQTVREHPVVVVALTALAVIAVLGVVVHLSARPDNSARRAATPSASVRVSDSTVRAPESTTTRAARPASTTAHVAALPQLPTTGKPAGYARDVAVALFQVDPATVTRAAFLQFWQRELPTVVYTDAAAKGLTLAEQNHDAIDNLTRWWIPPQQVWDSEATDHTRSKFTITSVTVPDYWANAVGNGTYRDPGLHMERVMGVLTQTYDTSNAATAPNSSSAVATPPTNATGPTGMPGRASTSRAVVIDLGLLCGPTQPGGCRLVAPQKPPALGAS